MFGHCIHLLDSEVAELVASRSVAAFCPTSNLFLGSGLFDEARLAKAGVRIALATDVGGGTSYSMLHTAAEGYKVLQLNRQSWPALHAFYRMTLGNARALSLDDRIGSVEAGKEADLVALDPHATPALEHRMETAGGDLEVELFALMMMGDDRAVRQTYVAGAPAQVLTGRALKRHVAALHAPAVHAPGIVAYVGAASRPRTVERILGSSAGLTNQNDRLALRQFSRIEARQRQIERVGDVPDREFMRFAHVDHRPGPRAHGLFQIAKIDDVGVSARSAKPDQTTSIMPPRSCSVSLWRRELRVSGERVAGVHRGWSSSHIDRHGQRFEDFLARRAVIDGGLDVKPDAVVAARRN